MVDFVHIDSESDIETLTHVLNGWRPSFGIAIEHGQHQCL